MREVNYRHSHKCLILKTILVIGSLWAVTAISGEAPALNRLDVQFIEDPDQWVIKPAENRELPRLLKITTQPSNQPPLVPRNLHVDSKLLAALPKPLSSTSTNTQQKARWSPCEDGVGSQSGSFTICYAGQGTAVMDDTKKALREFVTEGLYAIESKLDGYGERGKEIADQRAAAVRSILIGQGVDSGYIQTVIHTQDHCEQECLNRVVIQHKPFK